MYVNDACQSNKANNKCKHTNMAAFASGGWKSSSRESFRYGQSDKDVGASRSYNEESANLIEGDGELARRKKEQTVPPARHGNYKHGVHHCTRSKAM